MPEADSVLEFGPNMVACVSGYTSIVAYAGNRKNMDIVDSVHIPDLLPKGAKLRFSK